MSQRKSASWRVCIRSVICGCLPSPPKRALADEEPGDEALIERVSASIATIVSPGNNT